MVLLLRQDYLPATQPHNTGTVDHELPQMSKSYSNIVNTVLAPLQAI